MTNSSRSLGCELQLNFRDSLGGVEALRARACAVENRVAPVEAQVILKLLATLLLVLVLHNISIRIQTSSHS